MTRPDGSRLDPIPIERVEAMATFRCKYRRCRSASVHETRAVNAHFGAPVMHSGWPPHPLARQRLAASPCGRPWRRSRLGRGGERPRGHRCPVRARGHARFHTLVPAPSWGRSPRIIPAGRPVWTPPLMRPGTRRRVPWTSFDRRLAIEPRRSSGRGPIPGDPSASSNLRCHQGVRLRQEPGHQLREVPVMVVPGHGFEIAGVRPDVPFQPACAQRLCHDFGQ